MSDISITCPNCSQQLTADESLAGQQVDCLTCSQAFIVPLVAPSSSSPIRVTKAAQNTAVGNYAGFWKRACACLIDNVVTLIGGLVVGTAFGFVYAASTGSTEGLEAMGYVQGLLLGWMYYAAFESSPIQGTLGKMALGIKITDLEGKRVSFARATGRHFGKIISAVLLGIGFLMVAYDPKKQGLHDSMAGCLVVNKWN